jgi:glucose-6-phosphate 1-dehydrogenase
MHFSHTTFMEEEPQAYETIFQEVLKGEESVSVRFDEIEYAWKIIDAVRALKPAVYRYQKGSKGPREAQTLFDKKHGIIWKV